MINKLIFRISLLIKNPQYYYYILWNRLRFSLNKITFGEKMKVYNSVYLRKHRKSQISIGNNFTFKSGGGYNSLSRNIKGCIDVREGAKLVIGNNVGMSSTVLRVSKEIIIGNNVKIGGDTILLDTDSHSLDYIIRRGSDDSINARKKSIIIEDDVLIGTKCIILKGVTIGARSIIAAGSVVSKSISSDCIAAGNPCRVIKMLD